MVIPTFITRFFYLSSSSLQYSKLILHHNSSRNQTVNRPVQSLEPIYQKILGILDHFFREDLTWLFHFFQIGPNVPHRLRIPLKQSSLFLRYIFNQLYNSWANKKLI